MKKRLLMSFVIAIIFSIAIPMTASANSSDIRDIDTTVRLDKDGTAYITQVWDVTVASGTEWYLVQGNLGDIVISDFLVKDENGTQYVNEGKWNTDRSINEKANKCGIVDKGNGNYELCWGVGNLGKHTYTVSYKMTNVVKKYSDADGFIQRFVNDKLTSNPQHIKVTIYSDDVKFNDNNADIWAFGFKGDINFTNDGKIVAESSSSDIKYVNIMVGFTSGVFNPTSNQTNTTFEKVKEKAFKHSDYDKNRSKGGDLDNKKKSKSHSLSWILPIVFIIIGYMIPKIRANRKKCEFYDIDKRSIKNVEFCRDVPFNGSLLSSYNVLKNLNMLSSEGAIISAYILRWLQQGKIKIKETPAKKFLGLLGDEMQPSIVFEAELDTFYGCEKSLYKVLISAAGGDKILQEKEFYNWSKDHYKIVENLLDIVERAGADELNALGATETIESSKFFNLIKYQKTQLSEKGKEQALNMFGFKKYLEDFTIINERQATEVQLWDDYLVFASLFGIADEVSKEFKHLCPDYFYNPQNGAYIDTYDMYLCIRMIDSISYAGISGASSGNTAAQAAAGSGGFSSFGGGGGFSGGGSGGGSR